MLTPWCDWCGQPDCPDCHPPAKSAEQIAAEVHALLNTPPITFTAEQLGAFDVNLAGLRDVGSRFGAAARRSIDDEMRAALADYAPKIAPPPPEPFAPSWAIALYTGARQRPYLEAMMASHGLDVIEPRVVIVSGRSMGKSEELRGLLVLEEVHNFPVDLAAAMAAAELAVLPPPTAPDPVKLKPRAPVPAAVNATRPVWQIPIRYTGIRRRGSRNA